MNLVSYLNSYFNWRNERKLSRRHINRLLIRAQGQTTYHGGGFGQATAAVLPVSNLP